MSSTVSAPGEASRVGTASGVHGPRTRRTWGASHCWVQPGSSLRVKQGSCPLGDCLQQTPQSSKKRLEIVGFGEMYYSAVNPTPSSPSTFSFPSNTGMHLLAPQFTKRVTWRAQCLYPALWESAAWCPTPPAKLRIQECPPWLLSKQGKQWAKWGQGETVTICLSFIWRTAWRTKNHQQKEAGGITK